MHKGDINRIFYLNLLKTYILSQAGFGSTINITDLKNFLVVEGNLFLEKPLDLFKLTEEFNKKVKSHFDDEIKINTIDIIQYNTLPSKTKNLQFLGTK